MRLVVIAFAGVFAGCLYPEIPAVYDAGIDEAAGEGGDAAAAQVLNGCTAERYVDRSADTADRRVGFGGELSSGVFSYAPACVVIAAGQSVTFQGLFNTHPLGAGAGPSDETAGSPNNPIHDVTSGDTATVSFPTPGVYPYYCSMHYATGMMGVVQVR